MPDDIEYNSKKISKKISSMLATKSATIFYEKLIKSKQFIIEDVKGIENFFSVQGGKVLTCNHFNINDNYAVYKPLRKAGLKKLYKVIREGNYTSFEGKLGYFLRNCDTLPLSSNMDTMKKFIKGCKELLDEGQTILIYPEQAMWYNYKKPRPLKDGAFSIAVRSNVPIIPAFITMEDSDILDEHNNFVQKYTVHYLTPIFPKVEYSFKENCAYLKEKNYIAWVELYEKVYKKQLSYDE